MDVSNYKTLKADSNVTFTKIDGGAFVISQKKWNPDTGEAAPAEVSLAKVEDIQRQRKQIADNIAALQKQINGIDELLADVAVAPG